MNKIYSKLQIKWNSIVPIISLLLLTASAYSQFTLCDYDQCLNNCINSEPGFFQEMITDEWELENMIINSSSEVMNGEVYTIPVVFHVLNKGEAIGTGSNISKEQILQALDDLNEEFANLNGTGSDVGIQFCLAKQDPLGHSTYENGENITGIQRIDAHNIPYFITYGIWPGVNEIQAKALSKWPKDDYLNIWVAHRLYTGTGDAAGFAYFPSASEAVDGIALRADATGTSQNSKVITHEAGHYFALFHTFHHGNTDCPINTNYDCMVDGDMICQTRPHTTFNGFPFPCDESLYTICDPSFSQPFLVTENHMNYTNNDCRDEFVPDQVIRIRSALLSLRSSLLTSIGCEEGCSDVISSFSVSNTVVPVGTQVQFINNSINAISYRWLMNTEQYSTTSNWSYTFYEGGTYNVCLDAISETGCINRHCNTIYVIPSCIPNEDPCESVQNGDFEQISESMVVTDFKNVCGWERIQSSPYFCDGPNNNAIGLFFKSTTDNERITSKDPLIFYEGQICKISFDYLVTNISPQKIIIALASNNSPTGSTSTPLESSATIIAEILNPSVDYSNQINNKCYKEGFSFHHYEDYFQFVNPANKYITITGLGNIDNSKHSIVFIDNVSINCCGPTGCIPIPDFTYNKECPKEFSGVNLGDHHPEGDIFTWNFLCANTTMTGQNVTIDLPPGDCEVCLTVACDNETATTTCKIVKIPETNPECEDECIDMDVTMHTCKQDITGENSYIGQVKLKVPNGTGPCDDSDILMGSSQFDISLASYSIIDDIDPLYDIVTLGIEVNTPPGIDLMNSFIIGFVNLCDPDGNVICYNLIYRGEECDNCLGEITATASCIDDNPFDDIYQYKGNVTVDLPSGGFKPCDIVSSEVGYNQTVVMNSQGNQAIIDFNINTSTEGDFDATSLLCFTDKDGVQYCYTLNIDIDPCPPLPTDCVAVWATKPVNCTRSEDGMLTYNFTMGNGMIPAGQYEICDFGLQSTIMDENDESIEGAVVSVNYGYLSNGYFVFSVDFSVPCEFAGGDVILRLYFCDDRGNLVCFYFPLHLNRCALDCDDGRDGKLKQRSVSNIDGIELNIFPNPATNDITVRIKNAMTKQHNVEIIDQLGRILIEQKFEDSIELDISEIHSGLHFVKITNIDGSLIGTEKLLIIK